MIAYSPLHPRHFLEGIILLFAAYLFAFHQLFYFGLALAAVNYWYWMRRTRHIRGFQKATRVKETPKPEAILSDAEEALQALLDERSYPAKVLGSMDSHRRIVFDVRFPRSFKIKTLIADLEDIQRSYGVKRMMIESTVAGKPGVSRILLPKNKQDTPDPILLTDIIETDEFKQQHPMALPLGRSMDGNNEYRRLDKLPHIIVAGTTGSGKSVEVNSWIISLMLKNSPSELQLIMIDPKRIEFAIYENAPHLAMPVITEMGDALFAARRTVNEMEYRYQCMQAVKVRDLESYNEAVKKQKIRNPLFDADNADAIEENQFSSIEEHLKPLPRIALIIDEMSDLMMKFKDELEDPIVSLAQKARACNIHLILATQRPEVKVITGLIKSNIKARFTMQVATQVDSSIILDRNGAQNLLGNGDGYFAESQGHDLLNVQGFLIDEEAIERIIKQLNEETTQCVN